MFSISIYMSNKEVEIWFININQNQLKKRLRDEGRNKTMTIKKDLDKNIQPNMKLL